MRNRRLVLLQVTAAIVAAGLATASPAKAEDPIVKLVSVQNGKCLQPIKGSTDRGVAIVQEACNGSVAQQWTITANSYTTVHLVNRASNLCLDARGKAANGTPIQQWPCNGITNETWMFGWTNNLLLSGVSNSYSHCVATPGAQDGLALELRSCNGGSEQFWSRPNG